MSLDRLRRSTPPHVPYTSAGEACYGLPWGRIEGTEVSAGTRRLMELHAQGRIGEKEMIARTCQLHIGL